MPQEVLEILDLLDRQVLVVIQASKVILEHLDREAVQVSLDNLEMLDLLDPLVPLVNQDHLVPLVFKDLLVQLVHLARQDSQVHQVE